MEIDFLERSVNDLMNRLGAGNAHPGSGSAAAFQGMVSAKMISTVLTLTANSKSPHLYAHCIKEILDYQEHIENRIYPALAELFQKDSDQFEITIATRKERDEATEDADINYLRRRALEELKVCIIIPFDIAELCAELAEIASFVFDNCVKKARGDSQVGLSGALSALAGCISIIRLNVLSFNSDEYNYTKAVVNEVNNLEKLYQELSAVADSKIKILQEEFQAKIPLFEGITVLLSKYRGIKNSNIEQCVRDLQNLIWNNRSLIWKKNIPQNALEILKPEAILKQVLGYDCFFSEQYGVPTADDGIIEVAGVIDQPNKLVAISTVYPKEVQNFTAAHELAHAILHQNPILHRDNPLDRPRQKAEGNPTEYEADKFAAYFLMPKKIVEEAFFRIFDTIPFKIDENTAFKFGGKTASNLRDECRNKRELTKKLATLELYNGKFFVSLSKTFGVSATAMAIRIEELGLVDY
ncbi:methenyltetrahydrofolate cyclohydrolase [Flavobacterium sp. WLB]|uniref:cyclodeaminase/cyclohydrolase family protein n=1 Tax=Flavobacterium sp. WLB TaxID=2161662 RepID=UPI000D3B6788|nr:cyclodeaminase/cyclohydrolase family protein [Flavobacterium sp. WLB]PUU69037.1 methenyltetrahydrofolate cyclohydrolase [Flavobacterium sp. WLB]